MQVTVHLRSDIAKAIQSRSRGMAAAQSLIEHLHSVHAELHPLHPDSDDKELATHFFLEADSEEEAKGLVESLLKQPGVTAAYVKPPDASP